MSETGSSGATARAQSDDRTLAFVVYAMLFVAPFVFGLTALIGVAIAYVRRPEAEPVVASHYRFQIRAFWVGFALSILAALAIMLGMGMIVWELTGAFLSDLPTDPTEAVTRNLDVDLPVAAFVSLIVATCAWVATALWMIIASVAGALRLSADRGIRMKAERT
jgi:uncharacterized membrane protein